MRVGLIFAFSFVSGAVAGVLLGHNIAKKKYEGLADKEVESIKKLYEERALLEKKKRKTEEAAPSPVEKPEIRNKEDIEGKKGYINYAKPYQTSSDDTRIVGKPKSKKESAPVIPGPYTITPDEFLDSHYESKTCLYFADKVVTDEDYNVIERPEMIFGPDALGEFGKYEDDAVYVRDDKLGIDYEILLDERNYAKASSKINPKSKLIDMEDEE